MKKLKLPVTKPRLDYSTPYLEFYWERNTASGKTSVWTVHNKQGERLAEIKWHAPWRCYVAHLRTAIFDKKCLMDIVDFITDKMETRAERLALEQEREPTPPARLRGRK